MYSGQGNTIETPSARNRDHDPRWIQCAVTRTLRSRKGRDARTRYDFHAQSRDCQRGTVQDFQSSVPEAVLQVQIDRSRGIQSAKNGFRQVLVSRGASGNSRGNLLALPNKSWRLSSTEYTGTEKTIKCCCDQERGH